MEKSVTRETASWKVVLAWTIVLIPFIWGIYYTVRSSLALMRH
jgi:hypothetical protein